VPTQSQPLSQSQSQSQIRPELVLQRSYAAPRERIWQLWTTPAGIGSWWAPDGFTTTVDELDLSPGGALNYTMTATGAEQIAFMEQAGMPVATSSHKEFSEVVEPTRLAYTSLIDFVPGVDPYSHLTIVTLTATSGGTDVTMELEPLHDQVWTDRILAGRANELDNLQRLIAADLDDDGRFATLSRPGERPARGRWPLPLALFVLRWWASGCSATSHCPSCPPSCCWPRCTAAAQFWSVRSAGAHAADGPPWPC